MYQTGGWQQARGMEQAGMTAGTVSGTGLDWVYVRLLQLGDPGGHVRERSKHLMSSSKPVLVKRSSITIFIEGGKAPQVISRTLPSNSSGSGWQ